MAPRQKAWGQIMTTDMPETDVADEGGETEGGLARRTVLGGAAGGAGVALAAAHGLGGPFPVPEGPALGRRRLRAASTAIARPLLPRGLPDQPTDPVAVHRPAADPEGAAPGAAAEYKPGRSRPGRARASRTRSGNQQHQMWPTPDLGFPDPIVYKIDLLVADARVHHLAGAADRRERPAHGLVRRGRQDRAAGTRGRCR